MYKSVEEALHDGWGGALVCAGAGVIILVFVQGLGGVRVGAIPAGLGLVAAGAVGRVIQRAVVHGAGKAAEAVVNPSGKSTPYVPTFSHIEALEMRGDLVGAERAWVEAAALAPAHPQVTLRVAEFYLRTKRDRVTALSYYERLVALPTVGAEVRGYARRKIGELRSAGDYG